MTLPIPLTVRLVTARADRHIKAELADLSFRSVVPGGFASCQMSLNRPITFTPDDIAYYGRVIVYDERNGRTVWEGRLEDPGRSAGASGGIWELSAVGPSAHAHDITGPYVAVDSHNEGWEPATNNIRYCQIEHITSSDEPAILFRVPEGTQWVQTEYGEVWYRGLVDSGQRVARLDYDWDASEVTTNNEINMDLSVGVGGANDNVDAASLDTAGGTLTAVITTDWSSGTLHDVPRCLSLRNGPTVTVTTQGELWFIPNVRTVLYTAAGAERTAASNYTTTTVLAHEIVNDILGHRLTDYDGANASVATNSYAIDQFAYQQGVDAWKILEDLMALHPDHYWDAREQNPTTGKYKFRWTPWPTSVRYEADVVDGLDLPGSATELFNEVNVHYIGAQGAHRHRQRTQTVQLLTDAGLTRRGHIDLGFDAGSEANAIQAGDEFLAEHAIPLSGGRLTVARPIIDYDRGTMVMPWEIEPGYLIRVRGVEANQDALNASARDGSTVFKIVGHDYSTTSAAAVCELDSEPVTLAHLIAKGNAPRKRVA